MTILELRKELYESASNYDAEAKNQKFQCEQDYYYGKADGLRLAADKLVSFQEN